MPQCWYPFKADHPHAGKYYEGRMPVGMEEKMLELSGALTEKPDDELIVTETDTLLSEASAAEKAFKEIGEVTAQAKSTMKMHLGRVRDFVKAANLKKARASLASLEQIVQRAGGVCGGMRHGT